METISISTHNREEFIDITNQVQEIISKSAIKDGICVVQSTHTTGGITINEGADPDVQKDILKALKIFDRDDYDHSEGNSSAHVKTSLVGPSTTIIIKDGKLQLGTWQSCFFCEFDGPRNRKILIQVVPNNKI